MIKETPQPDTATNDTSLPVYQSQIESVLLSVELGEWACSNAANATLAQFDVLAVDLVRFTEGDEPVIFSLTGAEMEQLIRAYRTHVKRYKRQIEHARLPLEDLSASFDKNEPF